MWCCSWLNPGALVSRTEWHATEDAAETHKWRLETGGVTSVVVWFDAGAGGWAA